MASMFHHVEEDPTSPSYVSNSINAEFNENCVRTTKRKESDNSNTSNENMERTQGSAYREAPK